MLPSTAVPPAGADAAFERAVKHHLAGRLDEAVRSYREALSFRSDFPEASNNLATILAGEGKIDVAIELLHRAVGASPDYGEALNNLGLILSQTGRHADAKTYFERATRCDPTNGDWANNLGNVCVELYRFPEGLQAYDRAIAAQPSNSEFWSNRALALRGLRRPADAIASLQRAIEINPRNVNAHSNLGVILKEEKRFPEAIAALERAILLEPSNAAVVANLASVYEPMGEYDQMHQLASRAAALDPGCAEAYNLLANCAMEHADFTTARELYERAVSLDPENRNANWNLAILALLRGDFEFGWRQFEWRKRLQSVLIDTGDYEGPEWDGRPLNGRTILLHTEQGIGDAIQFIRYAAELHLAGAGRVVVEAPYPIVPLLAGVEGVDEIVARGVALPRYDTHANLMSLPYRLGTRVNTIPARIPYIPVEPRAAASFVQAPPGVLKVGIVWGGNPIHQRDLIRSIDLRRLAPLFEVPETKFFSLQKGHAHAQLSEFLQSAPGSITDLEPYLEDFRDTAAVISRLDLIITVDTSVAHLAGALGRPTWILLPAVPDFRWMLDRSDSPWYPTARLFRQPSPRDWDHVIAEVECALRNFGTTQNVVPAAATRIGAPDGTTMLSSATCVPDGRPRFDMWIPLASLADAPTFAEYEAELVGEGYDRALRDFWDEALSGNDTLIDATPGLGITAFSVATAPKSPRVVAIEPDMLAGERLVLLAATRTLTARFLVTASVKDAVGSLSPVSETRFAIRADLPRAAAAVIEELRAASLFSRLAAVALTGTSPNDSAVVLHSLERDGFTAFQVVRDNGEVVLNPLADDTQVGDIILLSAERLQRLSGNQSPSHHAIDASWPCAADTAGHTFERLQTVTDIGIDWELRSDTGWGVYGTNLALELARRPNVRPVVYAADLSDTGPVERFLLARVIDASVDTVRAAHANGPAIQASGILLRALGNNLGAGELTARLRARANVGVVFFEDTAFDASALDAGRAFDLMVAGSDWNARVLRAHGLTNVAVVRQGIDPTIFHPAPKSGRLADRFVVFSGGKLEYRKGQDLVVAAFRQFRQRHPDAVLLTAWHNNWPQLLVDLPVAGHVSGTPEARDGRLHVVPWLAANGIPAEAVIDVGRVPNALMGQIVREADVAVFPNRCEGGTNLVAMECMAAGVPTIVSSNTGHLDLVATGGCTPLTRQSLVPPPRHFFRSIAEWGESDVEEIVEALECLYRDRTAAWDLGARGAEAMSAWTWSTQVDALLEALAPFHDLPSP